MLFTLADIRQLVEQLEQQQQTRVENVSYNNNDNNNNNNSRSSSPLALSRSLTRSHSSSIPTNQHIRIKFNNLKIANFVTKLLQVELNYSVICQAFTESIQSQASSGKWFC
jgi:hypothetical protein